MFPIIYFAVSRKSAAYANFDNIMSAYDCANNENTLFSKVNELDFSFNVIINTSFTSLG